MGPLCTDPASYTSLDTPLFAQQGTMARAMEGAEVHPTAAGLVVAQHLGRGATDARKFIY